MAASMQEYEAYQESLREADELKTEQQYIDYFASVKVDVAPGQFTLEQLRDLKAKYEDLHAYSERDLSTIPEPDLLSDATPIPLGKASSGGPARHNSDTGWGKTLNWVDNHQILTSIGIGALAGISVALILLTAGTATPLVAAACRRPERVHGNHDKSSGEYLLFWGSETVAGIGISISTNA